MPATLEKSAETIENTKNSDISLLVEAELKSIKQAKKASRDEKRCTQCGYCITLCEYNAFSVDQKTRIVNYNSENCVSCGICVKTCPVRAMNYNI